MNSSTLSGNYLTTLKARRRAIQVSLLVQAILAVLVGFVFRSKVALFVVYIMLGT